MTRFHGCVTTLPLSSRPELRTRISYFALPATTTSAALLKGSRMHIIKATNLDRKSGGGAQWRDLQCASPQRKNPGEVQWSGLRSPLREANDSQASAWQSSPGAYWTCLRIFFRHETGGHERWGCCAVHPDGLRFVPAPSGVSYQTLYGCGRGAAACKAPLSTTLWRMACN